MSDDSKQWSKLLQAIAKGVVIPIVGRDLLRVQIDGREQSLYDYLTKQLATQLEVQYDPGATIDQVVAAFLTFGGLLVSWMLSWVALVAPANDLMAFIGQWSIFTHFQDMLKGAIDTRDVVFFVSLSVLFLYATVRSLESRQWR